jgi:hypothetical protein
MEAVCILDFEQQEEDRKKSKVPARFYEFYGVWFYGRLAEVIRHSALEKSGVELGKRMDVFIEPEGFEKEKPLLSDGIHDVTVYGHPCKLYKWVAQGYHRGLVVLADDRPGNAVAEIYYASKTWGWMMGDSEKTRLAETLEQQQ